MQTLGGHRAAQQSAERFGRKTGLVWSRRELQALSKKPKATESFKQKKRKGGKADKALAIMDKLEARLEKLPTKELGFSRAQPLFR